MMRTGSTPENPSSAPESRPGLPIASTLGFPPLSLQARMVVLSYLAYFFYYFSRKHLSVATASLADEGFDLKMIGAVNSAYAVCYMFGQFFSGALGDRKGPRIAIVTGMCLSGIATAAFGFFPITAVLAIGYTLNGLFQSTGWPNSCKVVTAWVSEARRGRVMGFWLTCYIIGSMAATSFAGLVLASYGWREVFIAAGAVVIVIGIIQGIFLINRPEDRGYSFGTTPVEAAEKAGSQSGFLKMLSNPAILLLGFAYCGLKYTRYALFIWLPFYLEKVVGLPKFSSAMTSNAFEVGGVVGLIGGGFVADRFFSRNRSRLALIALLGMIAAIFVYRGISHGMAAPESIHAVLWENVILIGVIGCFLYIADAIISGTAPQDIGGADNAGSACGIVNGIGSLGQILSGIVPVIISERYGWNAVFSSFIAVGIVSCVIVLPLAFKPAVGRA
ncbi:MFS transporter [Luteolibacter sp. Populi]|uniref:MFS transporter n=1 Tax=Luteolibacter sp. Populi TaxID=3230487 RepID=UPI0034650E1E